jgi:hypothetical protein
VPVQNARVIDTDLLRSKVESDQLLVLWMV